MSKKKAPTCCLVIDASIARAAGPIESKHPLGKLCRDFLLSARSVGHRMAWTREIKAEWDEHQSRFALEWLASMEKLMKLRDDLPGEMADLREGIAKHSPDEEIAAIILKDCHLVEAALATDRRITSLDDQVRYHLAGLLKALP